MTLLFFSYLHYTTIDAFWTLPIKQDYSNLPEQEKLNRIERDKSQLSKIVIENTIQESNHIAERWYELDDIGAVNINEQFLELLKEAETLYILGYYTGAISIIGIACEEFCRFLITSNQITAKIETQENRINRLKNEEIITPIISNYFHSIRKIRNDCMHYNPNFKTMDSLKLQKQAFQIIRDFKNSLLELLKGSISTDSSYIQKKLITEQHSSIENLKYRTRNILKNVDNMDLQMDGNKKHINRTRLFEIDEIDVDSEHFKEVTLLDLETTIKIPVIIDLTLDQAKELKSKKLSEGDIIVATISSVVDNAGLTGTWHLMELHDFSYTF